jgi:K+-sensing histidine kinase KdpD
MDKLNEMFNRFRTMSSVDENALSEMGLAATKKLVETMNGTFTYFSDEKTGNYFKIEFPSTQ